MSVDALPEISVSYVGRDKQPLVILDKFSNMRDVLFARAIAADFQDGGMHSPGLRARASADFVDRQQSLLADILHNIFGLQDEIALQMLAFALIARQPGTLSPLQRIPHYDSVDPRVIAGMYYLLGPDSGGTAFYRHRRTKFETITSSREATYHSAVRREIKDLRGTEPRYYYGDTETFELIGEVKAQPDRLVLYPGQLLHSGVITPTTRISSDPSEGRLTMNLFFKGQ